jgi:hypothetical protein
MARTSCGEGLRGDGGGREMVHHDDGVEVDITHTLIQEGVVQGRGITSGSAVLQRLVAQAWRLLEATIVD